MAKTMTTKRAFKIVDLVRSLQKLSTSTIITEGGNVVSSIQGIYSLVSNITSAVS